MRQLENPANLPLVPPTDPEVQSPGRGAMLERPSGSDRPVGAARRPYHSNVQPREFEHAVERAKDYIRAGDIFQVVFSQRFQTDFTATRSTCIVAFASSILRLTCSACSWDDFPLVGSSPELHVRLMAKWSRFVRLRHPPARGYRARTSATPPNCSPIPRNAPSTSCWSISRATTRPNRGVRQRACDRADDCRALQPRDASCFACQGRRRQEAMATT